MQIPRKMSAHNIMASISCTLGTRHEGKSPGNEVKFAGEESKDRLYEPKHKQKVVRVLTVVAYVISVSLAAIILSLYYTFIWNPKDHSMHTLRQRVNITKVECPNLTITPMASLPPGVNGFELEKPTISTSTTLEPEAFEESERVVSPQSNNVWKMLTESAMLRTSFPSASLSPSDSLNSEIQRVPEVNDYYKRLSTSETNAEN